MLNRKYNEETGKNTKINPYLNDCGSEEKYLIIRSNSRGSKRKIEDKFSEFQFTNKSPSEQQKNNYKGETINSMIKQFPVYGDENVDFSKEVSFEHHMDKLRKMNDSLKEK